MFSENIVLQLGVGGIFAYLLIKEILVFIKPLLTKGEVPLSYIHTKEYRIEELEEAVTKLIHTVNTLTVSMNEINNEMQEHNRVSVNILVELSKLTTSISNLVQTYRNTK